MSLNNGPMSRLSAVLAGAALLLLASAPSVAYAALPALPDTTTFDLDEHRWTHRPLLIFAPSDTSVALTSQHERLDRQHDGLRERDMIVVTLRASGTSTYEGTPLHADTAARLRTRFEVARNAFRVLLIGKDGTEKRRYDQVTAPETIFQVIDAMPMRQREMRRDSTDAK